MTRILIMGLPGSGKTYLAKELVKRLNAKWLNADLVRKKYNDWDFSKKGILNQSKRMYLLSKKIKNKFVVVDFICPYKKGRKIFDADFTIWMNTIKKGRFQRMNKIFEKPQSIDIEINNKNAKLNALIISDMLKKYTWDNKKPTSLMMGRFQPFHEGHIKLFEKILLLNEQVLIFIKDVHNIGDNPFAFKKIKKLINFKLGKLFKNRYKIIKAPNITNICYGRTVGYKFNHIKLPDSITKISATNIRKKLRKEGKLKKKWR
jgi:cytidyltransferase-like protein